MNEDLEIGGDGTEVLWFAELTEAMVEGMTNDKLNELCKALNSAVALTCEDFGVGY